jgi:hypothetical protein
MTATDSPLSARPREPARISDCDTLAALTVVGPPIGRKEPTVASSVSLFVVACVLAGGAPALGSDAKGPSPTEMAEEFLSRIAKAEIDKAYEAFLEGSSIDAKQVELLRQKTKSGLPLYGTILGRELIREESFGTSVVRLVYLLKCEQHPITWEFYLYKPKDRWIVSSLKFLDTFDLLVGR